jgi:4-hydroxybenzoate polyprenyltransferase
VENVVAVEAHLRQLGVYSVLLSIFSGALGVTWFRYGDRVSGLGMCAVALGFGLTAYYALSFVSPYAG